jgi:predicted transcriptional regulator
MKKSVHYKFSEETLARLERLRVKLELNKTAVVEQALREYEYKINRRK